MSVGQRWLIWPGPGPRVLFHRVREPKAAKNRVHLDVRVSGAGEVPAQTRRCYFDAEVARLQMLGATYLRTEEDEHDYFAVMTDPEGNDLHQLTTAPEEEIILSRPGLMIVLTRAGTGSSLTATSAAHPAADAAARQRLDRSSA